MYNKNSSQHRCYSSFYKKNNVFYIIKSFLEVTSTIIGLNYIVVASRLCYNLTTLKQLNKNNAVLSYCFLSSKNS